MLKIRLKIYSDAYLYLVELIKAKAIDRLFKYIV